MDLLVLHFLVATSCDKNLSSWNEGSDVWNLLHLISSPSRMFDIMSDKSRHIATSQMTSNIRNIAIGCGVCNTFELQMWNIMVRSSYLMSYISYLSACTHVIFSTNRTWPSSVVKIIARSLVFSNMVGIRIFYSFVLNTEADWDILPYVIFISFLHGLYLKT